MGLGTGFRAQPLVRKSGAKTYYFSIQTRAGANLRSESISVFCKLNQEGKTLGVK